MQVVRRQRGLLDRQNAFSSNYTDVAGRPFYGRVTSRQPIDRVRLYELELYPSTKRDALSLADGRCFRART